jgi:hypothetical protein
MGQRKLAARVLANLSSQKSWGPRALSSCLLGSKGLFAQAMLRGALKLTPAPFGCPSELGWRVLIGSQAWPLLLALGNDSTSEAPAWNLEISVLG